MDDYVNSLDPLTTLVLNNIIVTTYSDSLRQVRRLGGVLLGVSHKSVNTFLIYTIYTPKDAEINPL